MREDADERAHAERLRPEDPSPHIRRLGDATYRLLLELAAIPSVSAAEGRELELARFIRDRLREEAWFRQHPEELRLLPCDRDPLGRSSLFAMVRAAAPTTRTVLLTGHLDVVDTRPYGPLRELAFDPEALTARIGELDLSEQAREDLETGQWLFGRGVADMKFGLALEIAYLIEASRDRATLPCNLALLLVPDEEANSRGMIDAIPHLRRMEASGEARFLTCINTEPTVGSESEAGPTIYTGSIGKLNPFFYCLGHETHVGEYYRGLSAGPIVAGINLLLDGNPEFCDRRDGRRYPPYGCLSQRDLREEYSASVMTKAAAYYSYHTVGKLPADILAEMRAVAGQALREAVERHARFAEQFGASRGGAASEPREQSSSSSRAAPHRRPGAQPPPWCLSFAELQQHAARHRGIDPAPLSRQLAAEAPADRDLRESAIRLVERLIEESGLQGPLVVFGFLPPFYPHRLQSTDPGRQERLNRLLRSAAEGFAAEQHRSVEFREVFEGVSDLSYCGFGAGPEALAPLADNLPGWGQTYSIPLEELAALDIPVANIGPIGRDAHRASERLYLPYALRQLPGLLDRAVRCIGQEMEL
jgi:arginine utilization protein RocB